MKWKLQSRNATGRSSSTVSSRPSSVPTSISDPLEFMMPQILSHHVYESTLVAAFFLFSIGCLNMLLGLVFRESAKPKRSIRAWREEGRGVFDVVSPPQAGTKSMFAPVPLSSRLLLRTMSRRDLLVKFGVKRNSTCGYVSVDKEKRKLD
ncbi:hypothetical protein VKT23_010971 [Stygiomarasmius scandens]|uniref:Uncharacterized protein n=1 Tax=Marasmiellus scandens TaxID=2682957 RepID=A0ABR1J9J9_9AGAR